MINHFLSLTIMNPFLSFSTADKQHMLETIIVALGANSTLSLNSRCWQKQESLELLWTHDSSALVSSSAGNPCL